jgi:hypothetical protein
MIARRDTGRPGQLEAGDGGMSHPAPRKGQVVKLRAVIDPSLLTLYPDEAEAGATPRPAARLTSWLAGATSRDP